VTDGPVVGAVLAGGRSRRMGVDKATLVVGGRMLAQRSIDALQGAGIERVVIVGGANDFGLELIADDDPGSGPLGAVLTALEATTPADLVVLPCDLPAVESYAVATLLDSSEKRPDAHVVVGSVGGRPAWPIALWRRRCQAPLMAARAAGERSFVGAVVSLDVAEVELGPTIADADEPGDLRHTDTLAPGDHHDHGGAW
jgi:molybdopterin-guanine dinucleotide biosynthesis protein A